MSSPLALLGAATTVPDVSIGHLLGQMVVAIAVIGGGIWAFGKVVQRRKLSLRGGIRGSSQALTVLSRTSLGKDQHLAVVSWGGREVLVGISGQTITFLNDTATTEDAANEPSGAPLLAPVLTRSFGTVRPAVKKASLLDTLRAATARN